MRVVPDKSLCFLKHVFRLVLLKDLVANVTLQVCRNDDSGLTMTYFMAILNLIPFATKWEIFERLIFLSL